MRPTDVPDTGLLCDLLWSDPDKVGVELSRACTPSMRANPLSLAQDIVGWGENDRGVSFTFGPDVVASFLKRHDLDLICRAHQVGRARPVLGARVAAARDMSGTGGGGRVRVLR